MIKFWEEITTKEFSVDNFIAVLCIGSCEQHSSYLPLGTDSMLGETLAIKAGEIAEANVLLLPTQKIGYSPHHRDFKGFLTLNQNTMFNYLFEICLGVFENGIRKLLIINSHGGNQSCLQTIVNELGAHGKKEVILVRYWDLIADEISAIRDSDIGGMGHAGEFETSLMLFFHPHLVKENEIFTNNITLGNSWFNPDMFASNKIYKYKPFIEYSCRGNIGQPHLANKEKGEILANTIIKKMVKLIEDFSSDKIL